MKKILLILTLCAFSQVSHAQSILKSLLDSTLTNKSITSIVENIAGGAISKLDLSVVGTWKYSEPEVQFKSSSFLAEAGSSLITSKIESKLNKIYTRIGMDQNFSFTFNSDSTFTQRVKIGRSIKNLSGTYSLRKSSKIIVLSYNVLGAIRIGSVSAIYANTGTSLAILYDAKEFYTFFKKIAAGATSLSSSTSISALGSIINQYDGMLLGYKMRK